jgi:thiosulfate reductase/polysulfide reductase chain A
MGITRRDFLKVATVTGGAAALNVQAFKPLMAMGKKPSETASYVSTYCEMCFWKCGAIAKVADGRVVKLEGNPLHPGSRGKLCARGNGGVGLLYDPDRLKAPMISVGKRGEGKYKKASWDEALNTVAEKMLRIKEKYGPESMALFSHGSPTTYFLHLIQAFGSPNFAFPSFAQCRGARMVGYELTFGEDVGSPERLDLQKSRVVVLIGSHLGENMHNSQVQDFADAVGNGAKLIVVDPRFSTAAGKAQYWLPIKPGTDMALILAWINIIIAEGRYDKDYISKYATGFQELASEVKKYTPEWAEKETEIPASLIVETAREIGRYSPSVCIHPGRHVAWYGNDTQRERALAILTALLGSWGREGGVFFATKAKLSGSSPLSNKEYPSPAKEPVNTAPYPFAGGEGVTQAVRTATLTEKPYPIKGWLVTGTNLIKTLPNPKETIDAINKLDLLVAVDVMPFDTVMMADVILPECTYLERHDDLVVAKGRSLGVAIRQPAVKPMYESKEGWWIAKELAKRLGIGDYFAWNSFEDVIKAKCQAGSIDYEELKKKGFIGIADTANPYITSSNQPAFKTKSGKIELLSHELKEKGFDPIPKYKSVEQPSDGWFRLIYGRSPVHTFTRTTNNPSLWELFKENAVWVNTKAAKKLGLTDGQYVSLVNQDNAKSNKIRVKATERIRTDCVYMVHGFGSSSKDLKKAYAKGADDQGLITKYAIDPICGSTGMRVNFVKIVKEV